jgi:hypothetical protein
MEQSKMELDNQPLQIKTNLIDYAVKKYAIRSIMDVGACWGVNGGYTFHALENGVETALILDGKITSLTAERAKKYGDRVQCVQMNLSDIVAVQNLPEVDAILLFDVLLHQVSPDWDAFMAMYVRKARVMIIYNQDFIGDKTIRFVDLGREFYTTYRFTRELNDIDEWFAKHYQIDPRYGKIYRDIHHFWQFGITSTDIIRHASAMGFRLDLFENYGLFSEEMPFIERHSFLFHKSNKNLLFL